MQLNMKYNCMQWRKRGGRDCHIRELGLRTIIQKEKKEDTSNSNVFLTQEVCLMFVACTQENTIVLKEQRHIL